MGEAWQEFETDFDLENSHENLTRFSLLQNDQSSSNEAGMTHKLLLTVVSNFQKKFQKKNSKKIKKKIQKKKSKK